VLRASHHGLFAEPKAQWAAAGSSNTGTTTKKTRREAGASRIRRSIHAAIRISRRRTAKAPKAFPIQSRSPRGLKGYSRYDQKYCSENVTPADRLTPQIDVPLQARQNDRTKSRREAGVLRFGSSIQAAISISDHRAPQRYFDANGCDICIAANAVGADRLNRWWSKVNVVFCCWR